MWEILLLSFFFTASLAGTGNTLAINDNILTNVEANDPNGVNLGEIDALVNLEFSFQDDVSCFFSAGWNRPERNDNYPLNNINEMTVSRPSMSEGGRVLFEPQKTPGIAQCHLAVTKN